MWERGRWPASRAVVDEPAPIANCYKQEAVEKVQTAEKSVEVLLEPVFVIFQQFH